MEKEKNPQLEKFRQAARELGADDEVAYEAAVKKVAKAPKLSDEEIKRRAKQRRAKSEG